MVLLPFYMSLKHLELMTRGAFSVFPVPYCVYVVFEDCFLKNYVRQNDCVY